MAIDASPELLRLVTEDDPILHHQTAAVSFPLSDSHKHLITSMRYSIQPEQLLAANAPWNQAGGMAANQWGHAARIFGYFPEADEKDLRIILNPSYKVIADDEQSDISDDLEGCFSVPCAFGSVQRTCHIRVAYQDEEGLHHTAELMGRDARVWCHENDHLDGFLYTTTRRAKCSDVRRFKSREEAMKEWEQVKKR